MSFRSQSLLLFVCFSLFASLLQAGTKDDRAIYRPFRAKAETIKVIIPTQDGGEKSVEVEKKFAYRVFSGGGLEVSNLGSGAGVGEHKVDRSIGFFRGLHYVAKDNNFDAFISLWDAQSQKQVRQFFDDNTEEWVQLVSFHSSCKTFKLMETYGIGDYTLVRTICMVGNDPVEKWITGKRESSGEYRLSLEIQGHPIFESILAENRAVGMYRPCAIQKHLGKSPE